jgi:STE24 endopeptidase
VIGVATGSSLRPLLWTGAALAAGLVVAVAVVTPWSPWTPLDVPADAVVPPDPALDFTSDERAAEDAYHAAVRPPAYLALAVGLAATVAVGFTPLGARLVRRLPSPRWAPTLVPALVGGFAVLLAVRLLTLPMSAWQESVRRDVGLSTRDWWGWAADVARGFGVQTTLTMLAVLALVLLARRWPQRWWMVAAPGAAGFVVAASLAYPLVVEPVFNRFEPLADDELRSSLVALAEQQGVAVGDVLVADASRRTTALNAYVSGLGPTKRVVLYDTLLQTAPTDEIELVVAHELAHARENDVLRGTLLGAGGAALAVVVIALAGSWGPVRRSAGLGDGTGVSGSPLGQAAAVPLLLALVSLLGFVSTPGESAVSRHIEARADAVALEITGDAATFARMQRTLAVTALSDLDPPRMLHWWFASHPTAPERIAMARTWATATDSPVPPPLAPE